jgi:DNA-binding NtrC family response regulator/pSer/pThr/pTyr-binding forkhead associated (FHA) protein
MVLLSVESETGAVLTYRLGKSQISVGSSSKNDVVVRSAGVGERHLAIHRNGDVFTFVTVDRQSVVLNGERRARGVLSPGDKLRMGAVTLIFRGTEAGVELVEETVRPAPMQTPGAQREPAEAVSFRNDPAGFGEARAAIVELFVRPGGDRLQRVVSVLREALPDAEVAIVAPGDGEALVALASVWTGDLPRLPRRAFVELAAPGRYVVVDGAGGATVAVPVVTPQREVVAVIAARPLGALGDESISLLAEASRFLAVNWPEVERDDSAFTGWEVEARHRLEALLPGSSQAMQVLRAGMLAAAHGNEPVLVCGADGTGRTEVARILAALGPVAGRRVTVFEGRDASIETLRQELFGPTGRLTLGGELDGALGRARGGLLVIRHVDLLPLPLQSELAALMSAQRREPLSSQSVRWVVTCGEDPLALVQQGHLASPLFMGFSQRLLRVPRLGERREDLPLLIAALLRRSASDQQKTVRGIAVEGLNTLLASGFQGEMAELVGEVNRLVAATPDGEMVRCDQLGPGAATVASSNLAPELLTVLSSDNLKEAIPRIEQIVIDRVMRRVKGNQSKAARTLGISRGALIAKLKEYGVPDYRFLRRRRGGVL